MYIMANVDLFFASSYVAILYKPIFSNVFKKGVLNTTVFCFVCLYEFCEAKSMILFLLEGTSILVAFIFKGMVGKFYV